MKQKLLYICLMMAAFVWSGKVEGQVHLPINPMTKDIFNACKDQSSGTYSWDDGLVLGHSSLGGFDRDEKYCVIKFDGIPDAISFTYKKQLSATMSGLTNYAVVLRVYVSETGADNTWGTEIWSFTGTKNAAESGFVEKVIENKKVRYVKFYYHGNLAATFSNINITELKYLNVSPTSIDFGEHYDDDDLEAKEFTVSHCNAGTIEMKSDDPRLIITPETLASSRDQMLEETVKVAFRKDIPITDNQAVLHKDITVTDAVPVYANESLPTCTVQVAGKTNPSTLMLYPTHPVYDASLPYKHAVLNRELKDGYSTIALPFDTSVDELVGERGKNDKDWVAQLHTVAKSEADGFSLYFQIVNDGTIKANQPYVLHLSDTVTNPRWENITDREIIAPAPETIYPETGYSSFSDWSMSSNFEAGLPMYGQYGIVNTAGGLQRGGASATLNAFAAYVTPPDEASGSALQVRAGYVNLDGTTDFIDGLPADEESEQGITGTKNAAIYGPDGARRSCLMSGVNIIRYGNGRTQKVYY